MTASSPTSSARRKRFFRRTVIISFIAALAVLLTLAATASRDQGLTFGSTMIGLEFDPAHPASAIFDHTGWDGPTGEFSSGHNFRLRLPTGVLILRTEHNPLEVTRRRLPKTVPELTQLLSSPNHFEIWCAAEALGKMKEAALPALPALFAAAEKYPLAPTSQSIEDISLAAPQHAGPLIIPWLSSTNFSLFCAELLGKLGANANSAAPLLLARMESAPERMQKLQFAHAYFQITRDAAPTIPLLRDILQNSSFIEQQAVLHLLSEYGTNASSLRPEVRLLASISTNLFLKNAATRALPLISPD